MVLVTFYSLLNLKETYKALILSVSMSTVADLEGVALGTRAPPLALISFIFMQFSAKVLLNKNAFQ